MIIKNAMVFQEDGTFQKKDIYLEKGFLVSSEEEVTDKTEIDASGLKAIPGLVDVHSHGAFGHDFCDADPEGLKVILKYEKEHGITSYCPTSMTLAKEKLLEIFASVKDMETSYDMDRIAGINMEGPFISEKKKGAQAADHIRKCDVELFRKLQEESGGLIHLVDIAPENDGAMEFIREVKDDVVISIAHTGAEYDTAVSARDAGASQGTHLYNAMPPLNHRDPGVIGAARDDEKCHVELICDGVHIHPSVVRATFAMFGADRVILISDSMRATGLTDGQYTLGGQDVFVKGPKATLADGTIAGSATNLMGCMKVAVQKMGIPLEDAVACAAMNPAKEIGVYDRCGSITPGKDADFVLLDSELNVKAVYVNGKKQ